MSVATQLEQLDDLAEMPVDELYAACHTNANGRATDREMALRYEALRRIVDEIQPCTVRQTFYQAVVRGIVEKEEAGYSRVQRALVHLREQEVIPYSAITDHTRWRIQPATYSDIHEGFDVFRRAYRRSLWIDVDAYVEIWIEKDALAGVVSPITQEYDVPLHVARGFSSLSFLYEAAQDIRALDCPAYVYHLGDLDPSGVCAADNIEGRLHEYAPEADIHFQRLAVVPSQVEEWDLPTRPTKRTDTRSADWAGESVELDAVAPDLLRSLVRRAIEQHLPAGHLAHIQLVEAEELKGLRVLLWDLI